MEYGVFSVFDSYPELDAARAEDRTREAFRLLDAAEPLGFSAFWAAEHHFGPTAALPAPSVWLAAAAQRTRRIRLGALVAVLPLHDPLELAEQYALVDRISGGRLELGVGSGYVAAEFRGFGRDPERRRAGFESALPRLLAALERAGSVPPAGGNGSSDPALNVRPLQRPTPPVWYAAARRESVQAIGRAGGRLALVPFATMATLEDLRQRVAEYRAALPPSVPPRVLAAVPVHAGAPVGEAERALQRFLDSRASPAGPEYARHLARYPHLRSASGLAEEGLALVGNPGVIRDGVGELRARGVTDLAGIFDFGGLPTEDAVASMRRFSDWMRLREARRVEAPSPRTSGARVGAVSA